VPKEKGARYHAPLRSSRRDGIGPFPSGLVSRSAVLETLGETDVKEQGTYIQKESTPVSFFVFHYRKLRSTCIHYRLFREVKFPACQYSH
jgi:hypothetical protein